MRQMPAGEEEGKRHRPLAFAALLVSDELLDALGQFGVPGQDERGPVDDEVALDGRRLAPRLTGDQVGLVEGDPGTAAGGVGHRGPDEVVLSAHLPGRMLVAVDDVNREANPFSERLSR